MMLISSILYSVRVPGVEEKKISYDQTRGAVRLWLVPERASAFSEAICLRD